MWYHQEKNSIFYVESDCEPIKLIKDKVNGLFMLMLKQLMTFDPQNTIIFLNSIANNIEIIN